MNSIRRRWRLCCERILLLSVALVSLSVMAAGESTPTSVAFYYGINPPLADLQAFDIAVVEPAFVPDPMAHTRSAEQGTHSLFAYVSLGEVQPSRDYYRDLPSGSIRNENAAWGSKVIDQTTPGWPAFYIDRVIAPLWKQGWRGFFIDTLDSYQLFARTDRERQAQVNAMIEIITEIKRRYPQARLILNRGFELLPAIAPLTYAVAAESLYQGFDAGKQSYQGVPPADREWLLARLRTAHDQYHLPVISIEYVAPNQPNARVLARTTAQQVRANGFIPWVADGGLKSLGVSSIELVPRNVLVLVDDGALDYTYTSAQRFLGMPLNYLGLRYEFVDISREALPDTILAGRYAGVVSWLQSGNRFAALGPWMRARMSEGTRFAVFNTIGFSSDEATLASFGLQRSAIGRAEQLTIESRDPSYIGFETEAIPAPANLAPLRLRDGASGSLLRMKNSRGTRFDAVALTDWGGFALAPFATVYQRAFGQSRWVVDPIRFISAALQLPPGPIPDVTTEGGRRILMSHIDGDGFASRAELRSAPLAASIMYREFLERYRLPSAVSVIEAEISPTGLYPQLSSQLEQVARTIFALPNVEGASHSYSHPFSWFNAMADEKAAREDEERPASAYNLPIPGYRFNLQRELKGSTDYINNRLMPNGKKAALFLWSGSAVIPSAALEAAAQAGLLNMNGGETIITERDRSLTLVSANGIRKQGAYQVYAPNQNENLYTNNWTGPFYGFERVVETFKLTGAPMRLKPIDIYYHVYSASKPASIVALHKVFDWAVQQPTTRVFPSQYIRKVLDFEATTIARDLASDKVIIRTGADLRTLRLPVGEGLPDLEKSTGVAGIADGPHGAYLILASSEIRLAPAATGTAVNKSLPYIIDVNGVVSDLSRHASATSNDLRFTVNANERITLRIGNARGCSVHTVDAGSNTLISTDRNATKAAIELAPPLPGTIKTRHSLIVNCPA